MPKDPTKNVDRYKIRGGTLNEFEFDQNQAAYEEQKSKGGGKLIPGTPPEKAKKPTTATKSTKATKTTVKRGASAKKLADRKAAKKK
ncbi:MAG TPA: hypothetical protein VF290_24900 [Pyrinomonadaceae bacterium]